jgi:hypothetical protein
VVIFTLRQLEDLHKSNGHVVLPYGARMTPLAQDWVRAKKIAVGYGPDEMVKSKGADGAAASAKPQASRGAFVWWCDGPCGAAKAAVVAQEKESSFSAMDVAEGKVVEAVRRLAKDVKEGTVSGGVLLVQSAALACVLANRCASLRAIVGTTFESLEAGIAAVAANVLVVEYPNKSFSQIRNLLSRFVKAKRELSDEMSARLKELACA